MPTVKPRYTFTDTGEIKELIDAAQKHWPQITDRKQLLTELAKLGAEQITSEAERKRAAIEASAGAFTGLYPPDALKQLREDWPD